MAGGRPPKEKSFYNALSVALNQANGVDLEGKRITKLRTIAEKLVQAAEAGESWAIKEVADRIDGKPMQAIEASVDIETSSKEQRDAAVAAAILAVQADNERTLN
jgi:hypothetical protein